MPVVTKTYNFDGADDPDLTFAGDWTVDTTWNTTAPNSYRSLSGLADNISSVATMDMIIPADATNVSVQVDWKVSSELGGDYFKISIGETEYVNISGEETGTLNVDITAADTRAVFTYVKDSGAFAGLDAAWIDSFVLTYTVPEDVVYVFDGATKQAINTFIQFTGFTDQTAYLAVSQVRDTKQVIYVDRSDNQPVQTQIYVLPTEDFFTETAIYASTFADFATQQQVFKAFATITDNHPIKTIIYFDVFDHGDTLQVIPIEQAIFLSDSIQRIYEIVSSSESLLQHITDLNNYITDKVFFQAVLSRNISLKGHVPLRKSFIGVKTSTIMLNGEVAE